MPLRRIASTAILFGLEKYEDRQQKKIDKRIARMEVPFSLREKMAKDIVQIRVENVENGVSWVQNVPKDQWARIEVKLHSAKVVGLFAATLRPVRSDVARNFAKDFFLPTTLNQAIKVRSVAIKVFAILGSLVLDLLTFPLRLLTCIPTVLTNSSPDKHPFYQFLKGQNVDQKLLESGHVDVKIITRDQVRKRNVNFFVQPIYPANATKWY